MCLLVLNPVNLFTKQEACNVNSMSEEVNLQDGEVYVYGCSKKGNTEYKKEKKKVKEEHVKKQKVKKSKWSNKEWNLEAINAVEVGSRSSVVKVAIIDSGVDYLSDIDVYCRHDFISENNDDMAILFEDTAGHGTSVAGIIAAKDNSEGITGINPNVQLYSAKVLDKECKAPVSRVVEAIYWAIDNGVNIINISFGTTVDSDILHKAIQDAYDSNILIVAAAGNNGIVEYPAAYDEVMAVGSVDSMGVVSEQSAFGEQLEIVAPGEQIMTSGAFDGYMVASGTSMAAPHVTGVASQLWQKDLSRSNDFIRQLIDYSANLYGDSNEYGNGLVDMKFALEQYDNFAQIYDKASNSNVEATYTELDENISDVISYDDVEYVNGTWSQANHRVTVDNAVSLTTLSSAEVSIIKMGAIWNDQDGSKDLAPLSSGLAGMEAHPEYHGYYTSNYLASYIYLTRKANVSGGTVSYSYTPSGMGSITTSSINGVSYDAIIPGGSLLDTATHDKYIKLFLYGVAMHTVTDLFAHSTWAKPTENSKYQRIKHDGTFDTRYDPNADSVDVVKTRFNAAKAVAKNVLNHYFNGTNGSVSDFVLSTSYYDGTYYIYKIKTYANAIGESNSALNNVDLATNVSSSNYIID